MKSSKQPTISDINNFHINKCVSWYLVHSFLYYECDTTIIKDQVYDRICERIAQEFDNISHPHQHLLDKEALQARTGFHLKLTDYPQIVVQTASDLQKEKLDAWGEPTKRSKLYDT